MSARLLLLLLVLVGCQGPRAAWEERYDAILAETDQSAAAVALPQVAGVPAEDALAPRATARFLVTPEDVVLDASRTRPRVYPEQSTELAQTDALPPAPRSIAQLDASEAPIALASPPVDVSLLDRADVLADRAVDAATVLRVIDAIARSYRVTRVTLRVESDGHAAGIPVVLGSFVRSGDRVEVDEQRLELEALVKPGGIEISGTGGTLQPGCTFAGASGALTVPDRDGQVDRDALRACIEHVLSEFPDETQVYVAASAGVTVDRLGAVLATLHGERLHGFRDVLPLAARLDRTQAAPAYPSEASGMESQIQAILRGALGEDSAAVLVPAS